MKVHLIRKQTLEEFARRHPTSRISLEDWIIKLKLANWEQPGDIKHTFNTADILGKGSNRVVFNIAGNHYRMICKCAFGIKQVCFSAGWELTQITMKFVNEGNNTSLIFTKMETEVLKYTIIRNKAQYDRYCNELELLLTQAYSESVQDEIDLVTLLIEKYDEEHHTFNNTDPITLLRAFMREHQLKPQDMTNVLGIGKSYVSDILNYKKGLSKEVIRKLADYFKVRQEAFNRPYELVSAAVKSGVIDNTAAMNSVK